MRRSLVFVLLLTSGSALAQQESALHADFRRESERVKESCSRFSFGGIGGCAYQLLTDHPLHIAVGSIAPKNGFGFGLAFVTHYTPNNYWRLTWNLDGVASRNAWRAGGYMKIIHTPLVKLGPVAPTANATSEKKKKPTVAVRRYTVFNIYAQTTSLNTLYFFGLGPSTTTAGQSVFGMQESIVGGNVIKPVFKALNAALLGEVNGRFVNLSGEHDQSVPSIERLYNEATAPGLARQPGFAQLGEGIRIKPVLFDDHLQLNYLAKFEQFFAPSASRYSFMRWTVDLGHNFPLYGFTQATAAKDTNGPDECASSVGAEKCPSVSRNREGAIGIRLLLSESITSATSVVPFYFQQTLGGSDINNAPWLSSYQDYRFRAPNLLVLRESFEHSIWGPFGFQFLADQGRVALTRGDLGFSDIKHTFATGLTLRAGGLPEVYFLFAWGGKEGHHTIFNLNNTLLGGSARPLLD